MNLVGDTFLQHGVGHQGKRRILCGRHGTVPPDNIESVRGPNQGPVDRLTSVRTLEAGIQRERQRKGPRGANSCQDLEEPNEIV